MAKSKKQNKEIQISKSPAEFFAENQAIAGFDNMGKSLYTTIRELVENSLDACESASILPDIVLKIEEMNQEAFNILRGVNDRGGTGDGAVDEGLFQKKGKGGGGGGTSSNTGAGTGAGAGASSIKSENGGSNVNVGSTGSTNTTSASAKKKKKAGRAEEAYFRISVRDNGCGMSHDAILNLLGRVLSGSK